MSIAFAIVMAGGGSKGLSVLTEVRADSAVEFAGKYRLIDFPLSNCVNSDIYNVAVLTQYKPNSLNSHIGTGTPWDLDLSQGGVRVLHPYQGGEYGGWQKGTADAVRRNLEYVLSQKEENVLILSGDHIYAMDYRPLLHNHVSNDADITICVRNVSTFDTHRYGIVLVGNDNKVYGYEEKPKRARSSQANMGIYVFRKKYLVKLLKDHPEFNDFGRDVLPYAIKNGAKVYSHYFPGYWADVGNIQAYWEANMSLLAEEPALDLYDPGWVIHTRSTDQAPVYVGPQAKVCDNILANGCHVDGEVNHSVISAGVVVENGAVVRNSVILNDVHIGAGAIIDNCIIDKDCMIGEGAVVGVGEEVVPNVEAPHVLNTGVTVIGRGREIAPNAKIGRSVVIHAVDRLRPEDPVASEIESGTSIGEDRR